MQGTRASTREEGSTGHGERKKPKGRWLILECSGVKEHHWAEGTTVSRDHFQRDTGVEAMLCRGRRKHTTD